MAFEWLVFSAKILMWAVVALCLTLAIMSFIACAGVSMPGTLTLILTCGNVLVNPAVISNQMALLVCGLAWLYSGLAMVMPSAIQLSLYKPKKDIGPQLRLIDDMEDGYFVNQYQGT